MLFLDLGLLGNAVLFVLGAIWCWHVLRRTSKDWSELQSSPSRDERIAIVAIWAVTLFLGVWMVGAFRHHFGGGA